MGLREMKGIAMHGCAPGTKGGIGGVWNFCQVVDNRTKHELMPGCRSKWDH
jgi:hypothetical protein